MSGPQEELQALEAAAARLEEVARLIAGGDTAPDDLRALADEALTLGQEITERLPRALRPPAPGGGDGPA